MAASQTGAELFVEVIEDYGVDYVFGNPGTTELPVLDAIGKSTLEYVVGAHEDIAVGMAGGYAQTRRYHAHDDESVTPVGVVNLHIAPGLAHGLGNLYAAKIAGAPVVVTAGNHSTDFRHEEPILSGDLVEMAKPHCKWADEVLDVSTLPTMVRRAFRVALTPPTGPVFLGLPLDVTLAETTAEPESLGSIPNAGGGDPAAIARAAEILVEAKAPVMVVGDHVARAGPDAVDAAVSLAEASGLRVHGEILTSESSFPTDHDQWVSYFLPNEKHVAELLETDTIVFAGCSTNTTLTRHEDPLVAPETTTVHIGNDAWQLGKNEPADAAIVGDPGLILSALADRIEGRLSQSTLEDRLERVANVTARVEPRMAALGTGSDDDPRISKAELVDAIGRATTDPLVVDESVTSRHVLLERGSFAPRRFLSNKGGGLGYGLPAAVGASIAEAQCGGSREVIAVIGDGSYLYYPHAIYSATRHDVDLTVVIADNRTYRILKDNTVALMGGEETEYEFVGIDFDPPVDLVTNAESHGARAHLVETVEELEVALEYGVAHSGVDVLDVLIQE